MSLRLVARRATCLCTGRAGGCRRCLAVAPPLGRSTTGEFQAGSQSEEAARKERKKEREQERNQCGLQWAWGCFSAQIAQLLRACVMPAVRDVLALGRSAGRHFSAQIAQLLRVCVVLAVRDALAFGRSACRHVLLLLLPPWELRACVVPTVRDALAFGRLEGRHFSAQITQVDEVSPWPLPPWELHASIVPAGGGGVGAGLTSGSSSDSSKSGGGVDGVLGTASIWMGVRVGLKEQGSDCRGGGGLGGGGSGCGKMMSPRFWRQWCQDTV
ncbi:hypothetical protein BC826DRAFT_973490 [Russula brevipes]|nr:hypothetical protein BC826DRAFT_973490 [Russula brevipes]